MATPVRMPRWGMIMEEGALAGWMRTEGDQVEAGEILAEVESEKVTNEIEAPASGILARILVPEGETAPVGALLAVILAPGEAPTTVEDLIASEPPAAGHDTRSGATATVTNEDRWTKPIGAKDDEDGEGSGRRLASPAARRLAAERGIDWRTLTGSGPGGRVQARDISATSASAPPAGRPLSTLRKAIERRTLKSIEAPQAALCREIDLTELLEARLRMGLNEEGRRISLTALLLNRVVRALVRVPVLNSTYAAGLHAVRPEINIGVVVSVPGGIAVPVIRDAGLLDAASFDRALSRLVKQAWGGSLGRADLEDGTFTVSNAGPLGIDLFQPLLNPPEAAALGIGSIRRRPVVVDEQIVPRSTAFFCLSTDHRIADAEPAGRFLEILAELCAENGDD